MLHGYTYKEDDCQIFRALLLCTSFTQPIILVSPHSSLRPSYVDAPFARIMHGMSTSANTMCNDRPHATTEPSCFPPSLFPQSNPIRRPFAMGGRSLGPQRQKLAAPISRRRLFIASPPIPRALRARGEKSEVKCEQWH